MPDRYTSTGKWNDKWFRNLKPAQKCFWVWLTDQCDIAGTLDIDLRQAAFDIGTKVSLEDFGGRVVHIGGDRYWLPGFIEYQQKRKLSELNEANKAHLAILRIVTKYNLLDVQRQLEEGGSKGLPSPPVMYSNVMSSKEVVEKPKFEPPTLAEVEAYMLAQLPAVMKRCPGARNVVFPAQEAPKFFGHYTQHEWKIKNKPMVSWQQSAYNWLIKAYQFKQEKSR